MTDPQTFPDGDRGARARANLVAALRECGELADAVENFQGSELREVLDYLQGVRYTMVESHMILLSVVRSEEE